uniref:E3 ubiquitin-protein ligase RMA n=1 Tax=Kalanchoe fedtschenkoi TaxID=63787 RepID=A0A7N0RE02_KALFE
MDGKECVTRGCRSTSDAVPEHDNSACFDCNICLDFARDPVVTLCGHLYCWPCIYKWFHVQSASLASDEHPQCPVCKADVSHTTVVPLYGRGQTQSETERRNNGKSPIPPRPAACSPRGSSLTVAAPSGQQLQYRNPYQNHSHFSDQHHENENDSAPSLLSYSGATASGYSHPVIWMFGEMVNARMLGNATSLYAYPSSYQVVQTSSLRSRRHELQADKSLNRISIFLFFCFLLCLFLF